MMQETKNGHVYHLFCADKERRVEVGLDSEIHPTEHPQEQRNRFGFPVAMTQVDSFLDLGQ